MRSRHECSSIGSSVPTAGGTRGATSASGACRTTRACQRSRVCATPRETYAAMSSAGGSRGTKTRSTDGGASIRSTRNVRQSSRPASHATRYHRRPVWTRRCGSTRRRAAGAVVAAIGEPQPLVVAARGRDHRERVGVDAGPGERIRHGDRAHRVHAPAQPRGEDLLELRERTDRRLLEPADARVRRGAQADGDGDRLLLVEEQRRQRRARAEAVAARDARGRRDRIAEAAQAVDVAADGARADLQAVGEVGAGPLAARLQQRQEMEEAGGRLEHRISQSGSNCGPKLTAIAVYR